MPWKKRTVIPTTSQSRPRRCFIYSRRSFRFDGEDEAKSCNGQEARCEKHARHKGYSISARARDEGPKGEGASGTTLDRPGIQWILKELRKDDILVVDRADRLSRDIFVGMSVRGRVREIGATIEYASGDSPADTPEGRLVSTIFDAFAQFEKERIGERISRAYKRRAENGEFFGKPPIGWMRDPENSTTLISCDSERKAVLHSRAMREVEMPYGQIVVELFTGFGLFRGKAWSPHTVRKMINKTHSWE